MKTFDHRLGLCAVALLAPLCLSAASPSTPIRPGYWESTNKLLFPIHKTTVERRCILPADVAKFMQGPHNHIYSDCAYPTHIIENGRIVLKGECRDKKGATVALSGSGDYTPTSFSLKASVQMVGIPIVQTVSTEAHRVGDVCPSPASQEH